MIANVRSKIAFCLSVVIPTMTVSACDSSIIYGATKARYDGSIINNEIMVEMYPSTFVAGTPPYLERDFEAGADFICDEIEVKYGRDICAEPDINWR